MALRTFLRWQDVPPGALAGDVVVVIDVLRWSSVVITALANGAEAVEAYATPEEVRARSAALPGGTTVSGGERGNLPLPGFDVGNSPLEYDAVRVRGRVVLTTTTNGTQALRAAVAARVRFVGAFVNLGATVDAIRRELAAAAAGGATPGVTLLCAGQEGRETAEDSLCAGAFAEALLARDARVVGAERAPDDEATAQVRRRWHAAGADAARAVCDAAHAATLRAQGFGADVDWCGGIDRVPLAVREQNGQLRCW